MNIPGLPSSPSAVAGWITPTKQHDIVVITGDAAARVNDNFDRLFKAAGAQALALAKYQLNLASSDVAGILPIANLPFTGTPAATTFARGDGTWATVDVAAGGQVNARHRAWTQGDGSGGPRDAGWTSSTTLGTTVYGTVDANGVWAQMTTAGGDGQAVNIISGAKCWFDHNPLVIWRFKTGADITSIRMWFWIGSVLPSANTDSGAVTPGTAHAVAIRYSTGAADPGFMGVTLDNGLTNVSGAAIATIAASTVYTAKITVSGNGTSVIFSITPSGGVESTVQMSLVTATGVLVQPVLYHYTRVAGTRQMFLTSMYGEFDSH